MINPIQLMQMFQGSQNPQQVFANFVGQNPQARQILTQMQNSTNNAPPENIAMQLAQQKGMSKDQVMQLYNQLCGKR